MKINVYVEPAFSGSLWCAGVLRGLSEEAARKRYTVEYVGADAAPDARGEPVVVLGTSVGQLPETINRFGESGWRVILINYSPDEGCGVSTVIADYAEACSRCLSYFADCGRPRAALFGVNRDSSTDRLKLDAFLRSAPEDAVFYNSASLSSCAAELTARLADFDSVLCTNDVAAMALYRELYVLGVKPPDDIFVASFGDMMFTQFFAALFSPPLTTFTVDHAEMGRQAVRLCSFVGRPEGGRSEGTSVTVRVRAELKVRGSTACIPGRTGGGFPAARAAEADFYSDAGVAEILRLQSFLLKCEPLDFRLLAGTAAGRTQSQLADELFISEAAISYRMRRMCALAAAGSRRELFALLEKYIRPERLAEYAESEMDQ